MATTGSGTPEESTLGNPTGPGQGLPGAAPSASGTLPVAAEATYVRRRSHRNGTGRRLAHTLREWWPEILVTLLISFGLFLMLERMQIRQTLLLWLNRGLDTLRWLGPVAMERLRAIVKRVTPSDLVGAGLLLLAVGVLAWRTRRRLMASPRFTTRLCPNCGGELYRVHRYLFDRVLNLFVPVRRFRCRNRDCEWEGLRIGRTRHT